MSFLSNLTNGLGSGIASAATGGLVSGIIGAVTGRKAAKRAYNNQKKLNEQVFKHNQELAKQQNEMNVAQWVRENEYNTPVSQMERLEEAGLNPDLVVQGLGGVAAGSPSLTAGTPMETFDAGEYEMQRGQMAYEGFGQGAQLGLNSVVTGKQVEMMEKQLDLMNLELEEKQYDFNYKKEMKEVRQLLEQGQLKFQGSIIELNGAEKRWKDEDVKRISAVVTEINQSISESQQRIRESVQRVVNLGQDEIIKRAEARFATKYWELRCDEIGASVKKLYGEANFVGIQNRHIGQWYLLRNLNIQQETNTSNALEKYWDSSAENLDIKTSLDKTWGNAERSSQIMLNKARTIESIMSGGRQFIEALCTPLKFGGKKGK